MNEPFRPTPIAMDKTEQPAVLVPERIGVSKQTLWHSLGIESATMFAGAKDFSFQAESSYWYLLFRSPFGDLRALASVVEPRYSADTFAQLSHHFSKNLGVQSAGFYLRETVVKAMQTRKPVEKLPDLFTNENVFRVHMVLANKSMPSSVNPESEGTTTEIIRDLKTLDEAVSMGELGEQEQSIFRDLGDSALQNENIGMYLLRDKDENPLSMATLVHNDGIYGVWNMATHPDARRKGYGSTVLQRALSEAASQGADYVHLLAVPSAVHFYQQHGFVQTERALFVGMNYEKHV